MIQSKSILAIIPARGGSKGILKKNIRNFAGKPLIAWTIKEASKSVYLDRFILSSEDAEIIQVARIWGCEVPFVRPVELAQDNTPGIEPVIHAINNIGQYYDYVVLLQPTSPLRTANDIDCCIRCCIQKDAPCCISVSQVNKNPYWMYTLTGHQKLSPVLQTEHSIDRRQDLPAVYFPNGAVYVARTNYLLEKKTFITEETVAYIMPENRSWDIDTELDFLICTLIKGLP